MFFMFDRFDSNHNPRFYVLSAYETFALREYIYTCIGWVGENSNFYREVVGDRVNSYLNSRVRLPKIEKRIREEEEDCLVEFSSEGIRIELGVGIDYKDIEEDLWRWYYYWRESAYCSSEVRNQKRWKIGVEDGKLLDHITKWEVVA